MKSNLKIDKNRKKKKKNIVQLLEKLKTPVINPEADLKDLFYEEQAMKYGFKFSSGNFTQP